MISASAIPASARAQTIATPPAPPSAGAPGTPPQTPAPTPPSATAQTGAGASAPGALPVLPLEQVLTVDPGASCLESSRLVRRVARWLQRDRIDARIRIAVHGDPVQAQRVAFVITRGDDRAERTIEHAPEDCDQLHSALALSIALAIDASGVAAGLGPGSLDLPSDEELLAKREAPKPRYLRFAFGAFGHATASVVTSTSAAASVRLEFGFVSWLDLRLGAFGTQLDHQTLRPASVDGTFYVGLLAGRFDTCAAQGVSESFRVLACGGFAAGALVTHGHGFSPDYRETKLWTAVLGGIEAQAQLAPFMALAVSVDVDVPLARHSFQATDSAGRPGAGERQLTPPGVLIGAGLIFGFF